MGPYIHTCHSRWVLCSSVYHLGLRKYPSSILTVPKMCNGAFLRKILWLSDMTRDPETGQWVGTCATEYNAVSSILRAGKGEEGLVGGEN